MIDFVFCKLTKWRCVLVVLNDISWSDYILKAISFSDLPAFVALPADDASISASRKSSLASSTSRRSSLGGDQALLSQVASDMMGTPSRHPPSASVLEGQGQSQGIGTVLDQAAMSIQPPIAEEGTPPSTDSPTEVTAPGAASPGPSSSLLLSSSRSTGGSPIMLTRTDLDGSSSPVEDRGAEQKAGGKADMEEHLLFQPSAWNVVHLPPRSEGSSTGSMRRSNSSRQSNWHSSSNASSNQAARSSVSPSRPIQASSTPSGTTGDQTSAEASVQGENDAMDREEEDGGSNVPITGSVSEASANSFLHTTRFEHVEDEHGHHILTGREGKLTRCEDEVRCHALQAICTTEQECSLYGHRARCKVSVFSLRSKSLRTRCQ